MKKVFLLLSVLLFSHFAFGANPLVLTFSGGPAILTVDGSCNTGTFTATGGDDPDSDCYSSDDTTVATINQDTGAATAVGSGTTLIWVTQDPDSNGDKDSASVPLTVLAPIDISGPTQVLLGKSGTFAATGGHTSSYCFTSDNPGVVSINKDSGVITTNASSASIDDVTIKVKDDYGDSTSIQVTVVDVEFTFVSPIPLAITSSVYDSQAGTYYCSMCPNETITLTVTPTGALGDLNAYAIYQYYDQTEIYDGYPTMQASGEDAHCAANLAFVDTGPSWGPGSVTSPARLDLRTFILTTSFTCYLGYWEICWGYQFSYNSSANSYDAEAYQPVLTTP